MRRALPPSGEPYGPAGDAVTRLYLSDVAYGGTPHLLVVAIEGQDEADLRHSSLRPSA